MAEPGLDISAKQGQPIMAMDQQGKAQHVPLGSLTDAAWDGTGNPASLIALWKYIAAQVASINAKTP